MNYDDYEDEQAERFFAECHDAELEDWIEHGGLEQMERDYAKRTVNTIR
uniref:Uncharacterized protein n=1 Tax=viral metagenome TaxID=1070528 RepID=A0A6M3LRY2_9ZZZZ